MNFPKIGLLLLMVFGLTFGTHAQSFEILSFEKKELHYKKFTTILLDGKPIVQQDTPDGPLTLSPSATGMLTVATMDRKAGKSTPVNSIGFKVGIRDWRNNTLWMYTDETVFGVDLKTLIEKCEQGDTLIFMTVDRQYRLPRHEVVVTDGC